MYSATEKRFRDVKTNKNKIFMYSATKKRNGTYQDYKCVILSTTNKINMHRETHKKKYLHIEYNKRKKRTYQGPQKKDILVQYNKKKIPTY